MPSPAATEREALVTLLRETDPAAPTLLPAWSAHDLAAHLVVRDHQPLAAPGLVVPLLHGVTERFERRARTTPYPDLVATLAAGPGPLAPAHLAPPAELHEWYVHHEDLRRALTPGSRQADRALDHALWDRLGLLGPVLARRARGLGVVLVTPDARRRRVRAGRSEVLLRGRPAELFLWLFGRRDAADVTLDGDPDAVRRTRQTSFGL